MTDRDRLIGNVMDSLLGLSKCPTCGGAWAARGTEPMRRDVGTGSARGRTDRVCVNGHRLSGEVYEHHFKRGNGTRLGPNRVTPPK